MDFRKYDLIIFDIDGTLAQRDYAGLLPGRRAYFAKLAALGPVGIGPQIALASNQGVVGLRYWMESEGWGEPEVYPAREQIEERILGIAREIGGIYTHPAVYVCFAYQEGNGRWAPTPPEAYSLDLRWSAAWRKPAPGMLLQAMEDAGVIPEWTLMVGDREEDRLAAEAAGCAFEWSRDFFGDAGNAAEN